MMGMKTSSDEAYRQAGVDLKRADAVVDIARKAASATKVPWLLGGIGGFSGAFEIPPHYKQAVMLTACDGVGTKLKIAFDANVHDTVGIDLVAMSVNDILVNGGEPLAFLDYVATSRIEPDTLDQILTGIAEGCKQSGCALLGGETAEMPGFYQYKEYDLAGFCVGAVEKTQMYPRLDQLQAGDILIGLSSSGLHSNGYSLVRKICFQDHQLSLHDIPEGLNEPLYKTLLAPTRIYVKPVLSLLKAFPSAVRAMVHVTGGGFYDNIPRVLPDHLSAVIQRNTWTPPPVFEVLQRLGNLSNETMAHTFNCGIGFILVVSADEEAAVLSHLKQGQYAFEASTIGRLIARDANAPAVHID